MCDPTGGILTGIAIAAGAGSSIFGAVKAGEAAKKGAAAIAEENAAREKAQNEGFTARMGATEAQTAAQTAAQKGMLTDEGAIADTMRDRQRGALEGQQKTLGALNDNEEFLRSIGYASADDLMGKTSRANLEQSQADWQTQAASLLDASSVPALSGATEPGGTGDDPYTKAALMRRAAEAASNIRGYGSKVAKLNSYQAPMNLVGNAVQESQSGIMPAMVASKLLQNSAPVLFAPSEVAWGNAGREGEAGISAAQSRGEGALNIAGLQYKNTTDIADLTQSNANVTADNISKQKQADAAYQQAIAGIYSGIGNLTLQAAGTYGKLPGFLDKFPGAANLPKGPVGDFMPRSYA